MIWWIGFAVFVLGYSVLTSLDEIQIEGDAGLSRNLPTKRLYLRGILRKILGVPYITVHHILFFGRIFYLLHFCYFKAPLSIGTEILIVGTFSVLAVIEDFLWFALHPSPKFGIKNFKKSNKYIEWHTFWGPLPSFYWILGPIGIGLIILGG